MTDDLAGWRVAASSVRGPSHRRTGAPNQDAVQVAQVEAGFVLAVADGHGDRRHARSDRGSRFAVEAAHAVVSAWLASARGQSAGQAEASARALPAAVHEAWLQRVGEDLDRDPPADAPDSDDPDELLYGSTLLVAGVSERLALFLQIGDGDILVVDRDDSVVRYAEGRTDLPGHLTESLCQPDAVERFRGQFVTFEGRRRPALILLSSDGYANSFADDAAFRQVGADLKALVESDGADAVADQLEDWLTRTTEAGSGDDISLALLWIPPGDAPVAYARKSRPRRRWATFSVLAAAVLVAAAAAIWWWAPCPFGDRGGHVSPRADAPAPHKRPATIPAKPHASHGPPKPRPA